MNVYQWDITGGCPFDTCGAKKLIGAATYTRLKILQNYIKTFTAHGVKSINVEDYVSVGADLLVRRVQLSVTLDGVAVIADWEVCPDSTPMASARLLFTTLDQHFAKERCQHWKVHVRDVMNPEHRECHVAQISLGLFRAMREAQEFIANHGAKEVIFPAPIVLDDGTISPLHLGVFHVDNQGVILEIFGSRGEGEAFQSVSLTSHQERLVTWEDFFAAVATARDAR